MSWRSSRTSSGPTDVCLDVGANIGVMSLLLARLCPDGEVYAFEPGATSCDYLRRNVRDNELGNVHVENLGLYDVTDTLRVVGRRASSRRRAPRACRARSGADERRCARHAARRLDDRRTISIASTSSRWTSRARSSGRSSQHTAALTGGTEPDGGSESSATPDLSGRGLGKVGSPNNLVQQL